MDDAQLADKLDDVADDDGCDAVAAEIARMPNALSWARRLIDSDQEWPAAVGWRALALMQPLDSALVAQLRERVKRTLALAKPAARARMSAFT